MSYRDQEPCLCGDPECRNCFPFGWPEEEDEDAAYERHRQWEIDEAIAEDRYDGQREEAKFSRDD